MFLTLCAGVIVLSAFLNLAGWRATYEVIHPPAQNVEQVGVGDSALPGELLPGRAGTGALLSRDDQDGESAKSGLG